MRDVAQLRTRLSAACGLDPLKTVHISPDEIALYLPPGVLRQTVHTLRQAFNATFVDVFGLDMRPPQNNFQLHLVFALDAEHLWLHVLVDLDEQTPVFPSLVGELPATGWYEREVWEELGVMPQEHPMLCRLRLPPDWPEGVYPHRQAFTWTQQVPTAEPHYFQLETAPSGVVDYPLGPVRSGVVESGHYTLRTVGEEIVDMYLQLFYKHRGVEKRAEGLSLELLPLVAERISGTSAFAHSLALCQALERVAEIEAPPRARFLRTLYAELERLYNHLGYQADLCQATGLVVAQAQFDILKERVLRLNARISGHRYLFGMNVPGGLSRDLTVQEQQAIRELMVALRRDLETLNPLLLGSSSHRDRLEATGILSPLEARAYCAVGPIGRASGVDRDLRRDHPYAAYAEVDFEVPVLQDGDALARTRIRLEETVQALHIIEQILEQLPGGPVSVPLRRLLPGRSAVGWAESARGECVHWILVGEDGTLRRYRVRPASFANWQAFSLAIPGHNILTDFPVIEQSFGLSFAGADC
jgi:Ni,Fe-hydrogenase III large subunit/Ni,Fe-hydrogenase III component G